MAYDFKGKPLNFRECNIIPASAQDIAMWGNAVPCPAKFTTLGRGGFCGGGDFTAKGE